MNKIDLAIIKTNIFINWGIYNQQVKGEIQVRVFVELYKKLR